METKTIDEKIRLIRATASDHLHDLTAINKVFFSDFASNTGDQEILAKVKHLSASYETVVFNLCMHLQGAGLSELSTVTMKIYLQLMSIVKWSINYFVVLSNQSARTKLENDYKKMKQTQQCQCQKKEKQVYKIRETQAFMATAIYEELRKINKEFFEDCEEMDEVALAQKKQKILEITSSGKEAMMIEAIGNMSNQSKLLKQFVRMNHKKLSQNTDSIDVKPYSKIKDELDQTMSSQFRNVSHELFNVLRRHELSIVHQRPRNKKPNTAEFSVWVNIKGDQEQSLKQQISKLEKQVRVLKIDRTFYMEQVESLESMLKSKNKEIDKSILKVKFHEKQSKRLKFADRPENQSQGLSALSKAGQAKTRVITEGESAVANGSQPAIANGSKPAVTNGSRPAITNKAKSEVANGRKPAIVNRGDSMAANGGESVAANGDEPVAANGGESVATNGEPAINDKENSDFEAQFPSRGLKTKQLISRTKSNRRMFTNISNECSLLSRQESRVNSIVFSNKEITTYKIHREVSMTISQHAKLQIDRKQYRHQTLQNATNSFPDCSQFLAESLQICPNTVQFSVVEHMNFLKKQSLLSVKAISSKRQSKVDFCFNKSDNAFFRAERSPTMQQSDLSMHQRQSQAQSNQNKPQSLTSNGEIKQGHKKSIKDSFQVIFLEAPQKTKRSSRNFAQLYHRLRPFTSDNRINCVKTIEKSIQFDRKDMLNLYLSEENAKKAEKTFAVSALNCTPPTSQNEPVPSKQFSIFLEKLQVFFIGLKRQAKKNDQEIGRINAFFKQPYSSLNDPTQSISKEISLITQMEIVRYVCRIHKTCNRNSHFCKHIQAFMSKLEAQ